MEKQKRWQFWLIIAVFALTLVNILPTIFYYSNPLKEPVDEQRAEKAALAMIERVNELEDLSEEWLRSFAKLLKLKPESIRLKADDPGVFTVTFKNAPEANLFKRFLPRAGTLIPFVPMQLGLQPEGEIEDPNVVHVARKINVHLDPNEVDNLFHYVSKYEEGSITQGYQQMVYDRVSQMALAFGGPSDEAVQLLTISRNESDPKADDIALNLASEIVDASASLKGSPDILNRYFASFTRIEGENPENLIRKFTGKAESLKTRLEKEAGKDSSDQDPLIKSQIETLSQALSIVKEHSAAFKKGVEPITESMIREELVKSEKNLAPSEALQTVSLKGKNPFINELVIDWADDRIETRLYPDVLKIRESDQKGDAQFVKKEKVNRLLFNEIAQASNVTDEQIQPYEEGFALRLFDLNDVQSFLAFDLGYLAEKRAEQVLEEIRNEWTPKHSDFVRAGFPVMNYKTFKSLKPQEGKLGLVVYAPSRHEAEPPQGFRRSSLYVIGRGMGTIIQKAQETAESPESRQLAKEFYELQELLKQEGFITYSGASYGIDPQFKNDMIFALEDYYSNMIGATMEDFIVKGSKKNAVLPFTDVEQRIVTRNKIEDKQQEMLVQWKEDYEAAQADINVSRHTEVPAPTRNVYVQNLLLTINKYFRGDDRKILKWGLDLSGGKTVRIGLRDHNNRPVTNPDDLNQAVNELYNRINKMGVAERTIRIEGEHIILDFPGSQAFSAAELIKASAMYFHIVNEKFARNPELRETVNKFLQDVWNEAVVTNRKDLQSINEIAWKHLGGDPTLDTFLPRSEQAKTLYEKGLRLANPNEATPSSNFNDTLSSIAMFRGDDQRDWAGRSHPLVVVFHNFALEGSNLTNVQVGYDQMQGNILNFNVKRSYDGSQPGSPREDFYNWTSQFAEDKIGGTQKADYSESAGWRMAVVLNDSIVTAPTLNAALRDGGMISGRFSQREISNLAADLKAGSLTFTPKILSEQNVSPELGKEERTRGIAAGLIGLALVAAVMIAYYRFFGVVATCAILFNLLIMWGVLVNLNAALTLPGIAGIVLTIGMAVDANVLVFERFREEFAISGRLASALQAGYRKAFSAIVDSNVTTIIACLILTQFDSGPIKGFAVTLIIGIVSSMFTALFMTRYFFAGWVQNPKHKTAAMMKGIGETRFNFMGQARKAIIISAIIIAGGIFMFAKERNTIFGMDFTGGYSLTVELLETGEEENYRQVAIAALENAGAASTEFEVRELNRPNQLRLQLGMGMEEEGHPFHNLPTVYQEGNFKYEYERDPRISWVVNALNEQGLQVQESDLENLDKDWSMMSGQFSETMRNNALMALSLALVFILLYITIRFEFKYAVGAVIALAHDVLITMGILAFFKWTGLPVQIDLEVVGALMTLIGYSLNDTIIVFDRIREDLHILRKLSYKEVINHAINITLGRTIMTSGTTLLVLLALVFLGGPSIFDFSLVMTVGVLVGTFSSLFVAGPVLLYFHNREERQHSKAVAY